MSKPPIFQGAENKCFCPGNIFICYLIYCVCEACTAFELKILSFYIKTFNNNTITKPLCLKQMQNKIIINMSLIHS